MERKTNWLAVVAAIVAVMAVGFLWYGPVFGGTWMAANGYSMEGEKVLKNGVETPMDMTPMYINTVVMIVFALLINWLLGRTGSTTWSDGAKVGGAVGLIAGLGNVLGILFAGRPDSLIPVDGLYPIVQMALMGAIIGGWQKK